MGNHRQGRVVRACPHHQSCHPLLAPHHSQQDDPFSGHPKAAWVLVLYGHQSATQSKIKCKAQMQLGTSNMEEPPFSSLNRRADTKVIPTTSQATPEIPAPQLPPKKLACTTTAEGSGWLSCSRGAHVGDSQFHWPEPTATPTADAEIQPQPTLGQVQCQSPPPPTPCTRWEFWDSFWWDPNGEESLPQGSREDTST